MNFLEKLDYMMRKLSLNKRKLSIMSGVPYTTIDAFYKKGYENTKISTVKKIASALNVSLDYLVDDSISDESYRPPAIKRSPSDISEEARKIARSYEKLDARGKGAVRVILSYEGEANAPGSAGKPKVIVLPKVHRSQGITELDVFDEPAAAGLGNPVELPPSHKERYPSDYVPHKTSFGVLISGTSMEPKIPNGATVFVQAAPVIDNGEIGIFVFDGQSYCKQLKRDEETQQVKLHSINPEYGDIEIPPFAELKVLGRVLGGYDPKTRNIIW